MEKILIDDVGVSPETVDKFTMLGLTVMSSEIMTENLLSWEKWQNFDPEKTILVFPGNGGRIMRKYLESADPQWMSCWPSVYNPSAKRVWNPGEDPRIYCDKFAIRFILGVDSIVIIDDVVSSGKTCQKIRQENSPFVPGAKWCIASWIIQESANLKGFGSVCCHLKVGTKNKKCPVNSLSTLLQETEIALSYVQRNYPEDYGQQFLNLLASLSL